MNKLKKFDKKQIDYSIYLLTDDGCLKGRPLLACVEQALQAGVTLVQYRSKFKDGGPMYEEALALKALCDRYDVPLIINDRVDVALAVGAAGVHVGQDDLPCQVVRALAGDDFVIGVSAHNPEEARQAAADGAAIISGILSVENIGAEVGKFVQIRSSFK